MLPVDLLAEEAHVVAEREQALEKAPRFPDLALQNEIVRQPVRTDGERALVATHAVIVALVPIDEAFR